MQFFRLTFPEYETDYEDNQKNPIRMKRNIWLPGIICPACGSTWAGSRRLYLPIDDVALRRQLSSGPISLDEWNRLARRIRVVVGLSDDFLLRPGDVLGTPSAELKSVIISDFLHPFPGQLIVKVNVVETLQRVGVTGFQAIPVKISWSKKIKNPPEPPSLYELVVRGKARRLNVEEEIVCEVCSRRKFPRPEWLMVDEASWDGSDFLHLDNNPNIVIVTDRVCQILSKQQFANYDCLTISDKGSGPSEL